jgi:hypothetical protein
VILYARFDPSLTYREFVDDLLQRPAVLNNWRLLLNELYKAGHHTPDQFRLFLVPEAACTFNLKTMLDLLLDPAGGSEGDVSLWDLLHRLHWGAYRQEVNLGTIFNTEIKFALIVFPDVDLSKYWSNTAGYMAVRDGVAFYEGHFPGGGIQDFARSGGGATTKSRRGCAVMIIH